MFRLRTSLGCFVLSSCLLIASTAFAQIALLKANRPTVQQLQHETYDGSNSYKVLATRG